MGRPRQGWIGRLSRRAVSHITLPQHRNAYYLMLNSVSGAAAGLLFWFLFTRLLSLPADQVGIGYSVVALGTIVGVVAKGGFDTAVVRAVPRTGSRAGLRLLLFGVSTGTVAAVIVAAIIALGATAAGVYPELGLVGWALVAAIGILLVITWLQDAHFLAEGDTKYSFARNLVFSAARLLLPVPIVILAWQQPVAVAWAAALAASAVAAFLLLRFLPNREADETVTRGEFVRSAVRNISGSAAEFLPGLLLVPLVLALSGPEDAAYFGIAWTAATLIFLASAAISRSAMAEIVRHGQAGLATAVRRGAVQHLIIVVPAAILGMLLAPWALGVFGSDYAFYGTPVLIILCASALFVAPTYLYLAYLRAVERTIPLNVFPIAMIAALAVLAPLLAGPLGLAGVALAWLAANAPFAFWGAWRLRTVTQEVNNDGSAPVVHRTAHAE